MTESIKKCFHVESLVADRLFCELCTIFSTEPRLFFFNATLCINERFWLPRGSYHEFIFTEREKKCYTYLIQKTESSKQESVLNVMGSTGVILTADMHFPHGVWDVFRAPSGQSIDELTLGCFHLRFLWSPGRSLTLFTHTIHHCWTWGCSSDGFHSLEPLTQNWCLYRGRGHSWLLQSQQVVSRSHWCHESTPPFVSVQDLCQPDPWVLILILEISAISECHLARVQTLLAFQMSHYSHLSPRPITLPFDSYSPKESLMICSDLFSPVEVLCLNPD